MELESAFITGGARGIGLEMVKQLVGLEKPPQVVFATYRDENKIEELNKVKKEAKKTDVVLIKADVTDSKDIKAAYKVVADKVKDKGLTLLVNNAGVYEETALEQITEEHLLFHLKTNTVGPILVFKEMLPLLEKAAARKKDADMSVSKAAVITLSTKFASVGQQTKDRDWLNSIAYRISKTALNMAMRIISVIVQDKGILVVGIYPGWLKTDMGNKWLDPSVKQSVEESPEPVEEGIQKMFELMSQLGDSHHGRLLEKDGTPVPF